MGRTVVMVEHNLDVVEDLCDRVTVLQRGEIIAEGDYRAVSTDGRVREAYMGTGDGTPWMPSSPAVNGTSAQ